MLPTKFTCQALVIFIICTQAWTTADKCYIKLTDIIKGKNTDITLLSDKDCLAKYAYPTQVNNDTIVLNTGNEIDVFCPGETNFCNSYTNDDGIILYNNQPLNGSGTQTLICKSGLDFNFDDGSQRTYRISNFKCKNKGGAVINEEERDRRDCRCGLTYTIGFEIPDYDFLTTMKLCYDDITANTIWVHTVIKPTLKLIDRPTPKTSQINYISSTLNDDLNMTNIYNSKTILDTFLNIMKNSSVVDKYLSTNLDNPRFILRGQLIEVRDKLYETERYSTYFYANVLPFWKSVRAGNWPLVGDFVHTLSRVQNHRIDIWAGGLDVLKLEGKEIYLHNNTQVPVPKFFFKIVIDRSAKLSIVFVVVNNPYATPRELDNPNGEYRVCNKIDLPEKYFPNRHNQTHGYAYACRLCDFYNQNNKQFNLESLIAFQDFGTFNITLPLSYQGYNKPPVNTNQ